MTDEELREIEERANAATPGPWRSTSHHLVNSTNVFSGVLRDGKEIPIAGTDWAADADFIAASRSDVPSLVAEVRRLRALERSAEAVWKQTRETIAATD